MISLALGALPPWAAPFATAARAVLAWLKAIRITVNGVVIASLALVMVAGGWWIARTAKHSERARIATARAEATRELNADLDKLLAERAGRLTLSRADRERISGELRARIAAIPAERVVTETTFVPLQVPLPVPTAAGPAPAAPRRADPPCCDYPDDVRATLNRINIPSAKGVH